MSKVSRSRLAVILTAATTLASAGCVAGFLSASGDPSHAPAPSTVGQRLLAAARVSPAEQAATLSPAPSASPSRPGPLPLPSALASAQQPGPAHSFAREEPPPVVNGVRRTNIGSAHSPRMDRQLSRSSSAPPPPDSGALGVDVADFQHPHGAAINWPRVAAAGYKFAFIKATEGDYYRNPYAAGDLAQAKAAGLSVAEYHFAVPNVSGGASQAGYAVRNSHYTTNGHTLPLTLDIEYNPYGPECYGLSHAQMVSWVSAFAAEARHLTGQRPIIYTTADWWQTCTGGSTAFGADPLWVAGYGFDSPPLPAGWGTWTFWQFTSKGSVPGITGHVDISYFLRSATLPVARIQPQTKPSSPSAPASIPPSVPSSPAHSAAPAPSRSTEPAPAQSPPSVPASSSPAAPSSSPAPSSPAPSPSAPQSAVATGEPASPGTAPAGTATGTATPVSG